MGRYISGRNDVGKTYSFVGIKLEFTFAPVCVGGSLKRKAVAVHIFFLFKMVQAKDNSSCVIYKVVTLLKHYQVTILYLMRNNLAKIRVKTSLASRNYFACILIKCGALLESKFCDHWAGPTSLCFFFLKYIYCWMVAFKTNIFSVYEQASLQKKLRLLKTTSGNIFRP